MMIPLLVAWFVVVVSVCAD
jgi:hypothetical protein